ncbi:hypothetical protein QNM97_17900 [Gordonia sp. L191]|uniref:DUF3592 domain-containing protein n=1 Tax=Gordonia sp. L191 TaxID=2982699 RepID=UPI0024BFD973|nr:DUF3592 domain-containing protein [Gordonia sp. L191]WHU45868.1 hypothetical protein QNM97_17900 [Gordonia sp. L191]
MNPVILRRVQKTLLVIGLIVTVMAGAMVVAAFRNDAAINRDKGTVMADIVSADRLHAVAYFQTPDGQIYSPRLGLLYPTELGTGQRISVEYDQSNPDLAKPAGRGATLAIIPALSVAALTWLIILAVMVLIAEANRRLLRRAARRADEDDSGPDDGDGGDQPDDDPSPRPADDRATVDA